MQLILIAGQAGVGKTTLAHHIAQTSFELGYRPAVLSFAGPLKEEAKSKGYDKETNPDKYREFCQTYGLLKREQDVDYWVNKFEEQLKEILKEETIELDNGNIFWERCVIVDDCRFLNEVNLGKKWNAKLIFMSYGSREMNDPDGDWRTHESEELANRVIGGDKDYEEMFNYIVLNNSSETALEDKAKLMTPIWCETNVDPETDKKMLKEAYIEELLDILLLGQMDNDEEEEEDEGTEEGLP